MHFIKKTAVFLYFVILLTGISSEEIKKVALVVGNSNYGSLGKLKNPANDAQDISQKLDGLGFKVLLLLDADLDTFEKGLVSFSDELKTDKNTTGFFYYAGHGVQANGMNYLIPVGQNIQAESFLRSKAVSMQEVLDLLNDANNKTNIIVLDACRNNPFSWSRSASRGLTVVGNQPGSSVIVYSTSENRVALDGTGRNGVFTTALLNHIGDETDFDSVINSTAQEVINETNGEQHPAVYKQNFNKIFLGNEKADEDNTAGKDVVRTTYSTNTDKTDSSAAGYVVNREDAELAGGRRCTDKLKVKNDTQSNILVNVSYLDNDTWKTAGSVLVSPHNDETVDTPIEDHLQNYKLYAVKVKNDKDGNSYNVTGEESHHDLYFVITEKF